MKSTSNRMNPEQFESLMGELTATLQGQPLDAALADRLNRELPPGSRTFDSIVAACKQAVADGWMCEREANGIRYGRVIKPGPKTHGFSVDVVEMNDCVGPHHVHPNGEIDMVMPLEGDARFDGQPAGWKVYPPGSAHRPTVSGGRAYVLYLLPQGAIQFTKNDDSHVASLLPPRGCSPPLGWPGGRPEMKPFTSPWRAHAEDGVPGLRSANSYSLRPGTPPSAESVAFDAPRARVGDAVSTTESAGSGATRVNKNWLNGAGGPTSGCVWSN